MRPIEPWPYWEQFRVSINSQRQAKRVEEISTVFRLCSVFGSALTLHYLQNVRRNIWTPSTPSISLILRSPCANPPYSAWVSPTLICSSLMFFSSFSYWHSTLYPRSCSIFLFRRPYLYPTSTATHPHTLNHTHNASALSPPPPPPPPTAVLHFSFRRLSLQLRRCSQAS